jgi:segregation and condensation protein B
MNKKKSKKENDKGITPFSAQSSPKADDNECKNIAEALLFASGKKLDADFISGIIGAIDKNAVKKSLIELKRDYENKNSSLMIVEEGNFWKITVKEKYLPIVRKIVADTELSKTIMETLAVIAWKSPALQSDIIKIRTNKAYDHIDELLETGFITKEKRGRSFIIKVTGKFYEYFDIEGKEGIKEIFSKIKEKPVQKKVDEFKEDTSKTLGNLKVVSSLPENLVKEAENDMEKERLGSLELYDEKDDGTKDNFTENESIKNSERILKDKKSYMNEEDEEKLKQKTRKIIKELLDEEKGNDKSNKEK